jgi:hypothetical protein
MWRVRRDNLHNLPAAAGSYPGPGLYNVRGSVQT